MLEINILISKKLSVLAEYIPSLPNEYHNDRIYTSLLELPHAKNIFSKKVSKKPPYFTLYVPS